MNKFTQAQKKEFQNWVGGLCNGRSDQWKAELLNALLAEHTAFSITISDIEEELDGGGIIKKDSIIHERIKAQTGNSPALSK